MSFAGWLGRQWGWLLADEAGDRLMRASIGASLIAHIVFVLVISQGKPAAFILPAPIEIDLTKPFGGPARLAAPKRKIAKAKPGPNIPTESVVPKPPEATPEPVKEWTTPTPETKTVEKLEAPAPTEGGVEGGEGTAVKTGGWGVGADDGVPGGTGEGSGAADLVHYPRLLNLSEILGLLQRYYPESERRAGREGTVKVVLHIGKNGIVGKTDVMQSAGPAFDRAAQEVAKRMRFDPARTKAGPVAVAIPQPMIFRLED